MRWELATAERSELHWVFHRNRRKQWVCKNFSPNHWTAWTERSNWTATTFETGRLFERAQRWNDWNVWNSGTALRYYL